MGLAVTWSDSMRLQQLLRLYITHGIIAIGTWYYNGIGRGKKTVECKANRQRILRSFAFCVLRFKLEANDSRRGAAAKDAVGTGDIRRLLRPRVIERHGELFLRANPNCLGHIGESVAFEEYWQGAFEVAHQARALVDEAGVELHE